MTNLPPGNYCYYCGQKFSPHRGDIDPKYRIWIDKDYMGRVKPFRLAHWVCPPPPDDDEYVKQ